MEQFDLNEIAIFVKVVDAGSFTGAAKNLGLPKSTVSRKITQLEERLGVRLLQRTTRTLSLTDTGSAYYNQCSRIIGDVEEANIAVTEMQSKPKGLLRITAPMLFGAEVLSDLVSEFLQKNPEIQLDIVLTDQPLDLIQEGIDVAFRVGHLADSSLIARSLGSVQTVTCASPAYIEKHGSPSHPKELYEHTTLGWSARNTWEYDTPEAVSVDLKPKVQVNDALSMRKMALNGLGVSRLPAFLCAEDIKAGRLIPLLCDWSNTSTPIHALYPSNRHLSVKVRSFVDFIVEELRSEQPWNVDFSDMHSCGALNR
ncbi:LysR substrate-binding domain-containing protein [Bermanella sp. WJH001]|uniref:LysR family transcriptional regulator n=1 Tax=Bermanella sp. WJH001 TaxID=3048005 RepID=UPI0024BE5942|nr:LysR family transcriptional regulator [Bermanella sp. WJH001]MDJ1538365.1 LysR family transcriptional regulator [Bermanella sp. WJH001]